MRGARRPLHCGQKCEHSSRWDSYYCDVCAEWLEPLCKCTRSDYDANECHVDKWSEERPEKAF